MEIKLNINSCTKCPFFNERRAYTEDSFEVLSHFSCAHISFVGMKTIANYVEVSDIVKIPEWCPAKI